MYCHVSDFHKSNRSIKLDPSKIDRQTPHHITCAANTSETCSYTWQAAHASSENSSLEVFGPTINLNDLHNSMECRAECKIRNHVCASEPLLVEMSPGTERG